MSKYPEFDALKETVADSGGLTSVSMKSLRKAAKWDRLTAGTLKAIQGHLFDRGLGWFPSALSLRIDDTVRVYRKDAPVGRLVEAVLSPSKLGDEMLLTAANDEASQVLREIRRLVTD